jgi:hypothetical protein
MHHVIGTLLVGAFAGGVAGSSIRRRPVFRSLIKCGIAAKRKIQAAGSTAVAETRKIVDEARAELDHQGTELHN